MLCVMASLKNLLRSSLALAVIGAAPLTAHAIEVECSTKDGSTCTVSNDPFDSVNCNCADGPGLGTSGANTWEGFDEEMLTEVCEAQLDSCNFGDTEFGPTTTSAGTFGTDSGTTDGDTEGTTGYGTTGYGTTYGGESTYGESDSAGSSSTGSATSASGGGPSTDPAETTGSSASGGSNDSTPDEGSSTSGAGESSGSSGADGDSEDPSGCSVGGTQSGGALFAVFGVLLGLRRRR